MHLKHSPKNFFVVHSQGSAARIKQPVESLQRWLGTFVVAFWRPYRGARFVMIRTPGSAITAPGAINSSPYRGIEHR